MSVFNGVTSFSDPLKIYNSMLDDISHAKKNIYIETFRFENDPIGIKFKNALARKAQQGVEIKLLLDAWGTGANTRFFKPITDAGGEIKYFKKIRFVLNFLLANHERNHRKLLLIDDEITYISSINISNYNMNWREFSLRLEGKITKTFSEVFLDNYHLKNSYKFDKRKKSEIIRKGDFEIVRDVPSVRYQRIRKRFIQLIKNAEDEVFIETPYFLPTYLLSESLISAAKKGVKVNLIIPRRSDVTVVDRLRQHYLGRLFEAGVKIWYYLPTNLHSKLFVADKWCYAGSTNFDYRSFRYMFEIGLFTPNDEVRTVITQHIKDTLDDCILFDYNEWDSRSKTLKFIERLLLTIKHLL